MNTQVTGDGTGHDRVPVPNPPAARHAARRLPFLLAGLLIALCLPTIGGIELMVAGSLAGLPLTIGGGALALIATTWTTLAIAIRASLAGDTTSRRTLTVARRITAGCAAADLIVLGALVLFGVVRASGFHDGWTLVTALAAATLLGIFWLALRRNLKTYDALLRSA